MKRRIHIKNRSGQAVIEYLAMILVALSIAAALAIGFRSVFSKVWAHMACQIAAPCPHCSAPQDMKQVANQLAKGACK